MRRVVVTGLGIVCPLGNSVEEAWKNALAGKSGVRKIQSFDASEYSCQIAGEIRDFDSSAYVPAKEARRFDKFVLYGAVAGSQALEDSGLVVTEENAHRIGVAIGSGIGGLVTICENANTLKEKGPRRVSPFLIPGCIINMASGEFSILKGLKGPNVAYATACSTGLHAIGEAACIIARGDADAMVAGGAEAPICPVGISGFDNMHALSRRNDEPEKASRPFDKDRNGFVMGEGSGIVVLEEYEHAKARGAHIYCEVKGYGLSGDAYNITTPSVDGPTRCMQMALDHAGLKPSDIQYLNAHGTSTSIGDANESKAVMQVFGDDVKNLVMSSTKSMTGHLLGGAGGIESVFTILALRDQIVPPTINVENQDPACPVDCCPNTARKMPVKNAMKNSFGFGGTNSTIIYGLVD
ncbi:beta-ketoacyl-ACP synthase II [Mesosutterella multiformis]|jgi:3-oxoacyl-[acyl-carrier-protein] synthase II|uniref:3-oxoacyl-[acyl-carrier-protein] synthase 2 n=1 Tax=Mesosutterella multiformis TaxID=2259133 RepID=A0A388SB79_9BURK|nr:beta-ketoacyl-ACP synthase II [Mesosutterella multiformis]MBS5812393.1 beta-ketoacyl-ACP synthase II [Sutterella sp.]MCH3935379.1 beta-ketoacyl-ACP synthase II [Mesosutterella sp.]RGU80267.1 beta-ketoacyl-[acyl-carrier-protein] synthase II [Sutterella sp. AF15-45LB]RGU81206.1 beta-ketoacyl-[acyl-carrier-protein] synthase II [Sutterella sp. AF15-44LB]RHH09432.1 beta-ketoacyl-[acyl-carrier-protein] synthase II [Sutterella sp. AM18-8-1]